MYVGMAIMWQSLSLMRAVGVSEDVGMKEGVCA